MPASKVMQNNEHSQSGGTGSHHMQSKRAKKSHNALQVINPPLVNEDSYSQQEMSISKGLPP